MRAPAAPVPRYRHDRVALSLQRKTMRVVMLLRSRMPPRPPDQANPRLDPHHPQPRNPYLDHPPETAPTPPPPPTTPTEQAAGLRPRSDTIVVCSVTGVDPGWDDRGVRRAGPPAPWARRPAGAQRPQRLLPLTPASANSSRFRATGVGIAHPTGFLVQFAGLAPSSRRCLNRLVTPMLGWRPNSRMSTERPSAWTAHTSCLG